MNGVGDGDGTPDALQDGDGDGLVNGSKQTRGTNPANPDTDGNGLSDGAEVVVHATNPLAVDRDDDACGDGKELTFATRNPTDRRAGAALTAAPNPLVVFRDSAVGAADAQAMFACFRAGAQTGKPVLSRTSMAWREGRSRV